MRNCLSFFLLLWATSWATSAGAQWIVPAPVDSLWRAYRHTQPDTDRVNLLLQLGQQYLLRGTEHPGSLDTALQLSQQAYALSRGLRYLRGQGKSDVIAAQALREQGKRQEGRQRIARGLGWLNQYGSLSDRAEAYTELAAYYGASGEDLVQKIRLYEQIVPLLQRAGDTLSLAHALKFRGDLYQLQSNNVRALLDLDRALALYRAVGYPQVQEVYDLMGFVARKTGDYEAGIRYGLLSMKAAEESGDSVKLAKIYSRLGVIYRELNQGEKAHDYFDKSLRTAQRLHRRSTIVLLATTISAVLDGNSKKEAEALHLEEALLHLQEIIKKQPAYKDDVDCQVAVAGCFVKLYGNLHEQYARAKPFSDQLEALLRTNLGEDYQKYIHGVLIPFYIQSRQYKPAKVLLARNERICTNASYGKELSINHLWWFKLDSAQANYSSAIRHYQRYKALSDSLINEATNQKTAQLEVQYKTQEKEHKIVQLRQQTALQQNALLKAQTTRNFIIAGAVMLALLLVLGYNRYRLKQRSNQLLEAKQREINQKNQSLQELLHEKELLLTEKEWMLKEIHHRVKNNLQVVMSLLNSQAAYLRDDAALSAIQESGHRVQAMALIHQKLYQSEQVARIYMPAYVNEVVAYLHDSYSPQQTIRFQLSVDPIELDVTLAVPLGLIINEAITNAFKYAFPAGRSGRVSLSLLRLNKPGYQLIVEDDGVGLPSGYDPARSRSLGMTLMHGFSEQLGGELRIRSGPGLCISLEFEDEQFNPTYSQADYAY